MSYLALNDVFNEIGKGIEDKVVVDVTNRRLSARARICHKCARSLGVSTTGAPSTLSPRMVTWRVSTSTPYDVPPVPGGKGRPFQWSFRGTVWMSVGAADSLMDARQMAPIGQDGE